MAGVYHHNSWGPLTSLAFNNTGYASIGAGTQSNMFSTAGGEAQRQFLIREAGTFDKLGVSINANTIATSASTVTFRNNAADGNQTISISAGTTGFFQDVTNSDTASAGDKISLKFVTPNTSGSLNPNGTVWQFSATSGSNTGFLIGGFQTHSATSVSRYNAMNSGNGGQTSESMTQTLIRVGATLKNLCVNVQSPRASAETVTVRVNGAAGTLTATTTASTSGFYEDTTHSDSVTSGDLLNYIINLGGSAGTLIHQTSVQIDFSSSTDVALFGGCGTNVGAGVTTYFGAGGSNNPNTTEALTKSTIKQAATYSKFAFNILTNATTASSTVRTRLNGSNGGQSVSVGSGTTGLFEDTTNSDTLADGDNFGIQLTAGTGGTINFGNSSFKVVVASSVTTSYSRMPLLGVR